MRIAITGISHETNTYCRDLTQLSDFYLIRGQRFFKSRGQESDLGGAVDACERLGIEPVPILWANTQPSGTIARDAYDSMKQEILDGLSQAGALDGIVLCLHGAGVVEGIEDLEADLAEAIRTLVGVEIPITASFDLHGNITQRMADALDGIFGCHHYPHIDLHKRADEAVALIARIRQENLKTAIHVERVPILMPTTTTFLDPGKAMLEKMLAAEQDNDVIDVSWFHGFPYTDIAHIGSYISVTTTGNYERAREIAKRLATGLWHARESFRAVSLSADEAVQTALSQPGQPIVINETSDNTGGGTPGDGTHLLRAMLEAKLDSACFGFIVDPAVAQQAHQAGVGAVIDVSLGGKYDDLHGKPLALKAYVKALSDGHVTMQAMFKGMPLNLGNLARLVVDGIDIVVSSKRSQTFDVEPFLAVGIDVMRYKIVALKSSNHFRAGFQDLAAAIVTADPPGLTTHHIEIFPRHNADQPLWPLDAQASYTA